MSNFIIFILGAFAGGIIGGTIMALCAAARDKEDNHA